MACFFIAVEFALPENCYLAFRLNGQNDRAADIEDVVQRGLGMLPQQAICEE